MLPMVSTGLLLGVLLWAGLLMWRFPVQFGLSVLCAVVFMDCINFLDDGINVGMFIHSDDVACAALTCAAVLIFFRNRALFTGYLCKPALILLGLAALNFLRGALLYGERPAGNGVRHLIHLVVPFLAISVIGRAKKFSFLRITLFLCGASLVFTAVAALRWGGVIPTPDLYEDFRQISRVLAADYPMLIGQALIAVVGIQLRSGVKTWAMLAALLFAAMVLFSQHRSVWLATALGLAWLAFRSLRVASPKQVVQFWGAAVGATLIAVVVVTASGHAEFVTTMLKSNVEETKREDSTLAWRVNGYDEALHRAVSGGAFELLLGPPSGRDLDDIASLASVQIHNRYVDTFAFYGIFGLVLLVAWFWMLSVHVFGTGLSARWGISTSASGLPLEGLLLSQFAYFMAYAGNMVSGSMLGILWAASLTISSDRRSGDELFADLFVPDRPQALTTK